MKVTRSFNVPRIDVEQYRSALDRHMKEALAEGLMVWLDAVLLEIPNWTGASRATFWRLAETINAHVDASGPRVGVGQLAGDGSLVTDRTRGVYTFTYSTTLPWLVWNEYHDANVDLDPTKYPPPAKLKKPGPYHFQAKGAFAFMRSADKVRLPAVSPYVKSYPVKQ
jgi:hypothetical protein